MVRAGQATRRRAPGGSFIWPKTSTVVVEHARLAVISSHRSLPSRVRSPTPGEHREAAVLGRDVADQLLDQHGLADAGAAEQADLAALGEGAEQVDDLDAGLEDLGDRLLLLEGGRRAVDRPAALASGRPRPLPSSASPSRLKMRPLVRLADRHRDRRAGVDRTAHAAAAAVGRRHGHAARDVVAEVLAHLEVSRSCARRRDLQRVVDRGQLPGRERDVDHGAEDLDDPAGAAAVLAVAIGLDLPRSGARAARLGAADDVEQLLGDRSPGALL